MGEELGEAVSNIGCTWDMTKCHEPCSNRFAYAMERQTDVAFGELEVRDGRAVNHTLVVTEHPGHVFKIGTEHDEVVSELNDLLGCLSCSHELTTICCCLHSVLSA